MNILLTGGAGYIGSHTAYALKKAGYTPIVLDSLVNGHEWAVKYGPFVKGDMGDENAVKALCVEYRPQAVIHFAAFIEVAESVANPAKYMGNNYHKAAKFFDAVAECGVNKIVFSSTAAVYGIPQDEASIKETHPLQPINPYGESKLAAETYLRDMGVDSVTLRYFNAAGAAPIEEKIGEAHDPETHLIPNVLRAGLNGKNPVKLFGTDYPTPDGTAVRDYVHVMDLAAAHIAALRYLMDGGTTEICNLGTGKGSSVQEVIDTCAQALGKPVPVVRETRRAGDPPRLVADNTHAKELINWTPQSSLNDIVQSALAWHKHFAP